MEKPDETRLPQKGMDLAEIQRIVTMLWRGRLIVAGAVALGILAAIIYLHLATYTYTTTLTLIPTQPQQRDLGGQLGGLAAVAGINLPATPTAVSPFTVYPETAQTRQVAADMIRVWPEVMPALFGGQWNPETKTWHEPSSLSRTILGVLRPILGIPAYKWRAPGAPELQQYIASAVGVGQDKKKPILTISLSNKDPDFARKFILTMHQSTDRVLRRMTLDRAKKYAGYLEIKLMTTQTSVVRDVLTQSLSEQETLVMMGNADTDFAAQPLSPPESSLRPTRPVPVIVLLVGILLGLFAGVGLILVMPSVQESDDFRRTKLGSGLVKLGKGQGILK
jgi:hypothetical protein